MSGLSSAGKMRAPGMVNAEGSRAPDLVGGGDDCSTERDAPTRIPLRARDGSVRAWALVDAEDAAWLNQWRWSLCAGYAHRKTKRAGKQGQVYMHRAIADPTGELEVDHKSGDTLDNRRSNLRLGSHALNRQNNKMYTNNTSGFRGVSWDKHRRKWSAYAKLGGKRRFLGRYDDIEEAARAAAVFREENMPYATS